MIIDVYPPDYTSLVGQVRALTNDVEQRVDPARTDDGPQYLISDGQLTALLSVSKQRPKFAAAAVMDMIASNEALVSKKIRTEDLQTDGPAVANAIRLHAQNLRAEAQHDYLEDSADFNIVDHSEPLPMYGYGYGMDGLYFYPQYDFIVEGGV